MSDVQISPVPARVVIPEILDHLPPDDPAAIRSRRDLRLINALMGNDRWLLKTVRKFPAAAAKGITELGAGDGTLTAKLAAAFPKSTITALDLAPRPPGLAPNIRWRQGDMFHSETPIQGGILVANLFLHHFEGEALQQLGQLCRNFDVLIFSEPARAKFPHLLGGLMDPFVNRVTRHDLHVSIRAGFTKGELPQLLALPPQHWEIREHSTWRGAARMLGWPV